MHLTYCESSISVSLILYYVLLLQLTADTDTRLHVIQIVLAVLLYYLANQRRSYVDEN